MYVCVCFFWLHGGLACRVVTGCRVSCSHTLTLKLFLFHRLSVYTCVRDFNCGEGQLLLGEVIVISCSVTFVKQKASLAQ